MNLCCSFVAEFMSGFSAQPSLTAARLCPHLQACSPELEPWYAADGSLNTAALGAYIGTMNDEAVKNALQRLQRLLDHKPLARASGQAVAPGEALPAAVVRELQCTASC